MTCLSRGLAACAVAIVSVTLQGCGGVTTTTTSAGPTTTKPKPAPTTTTTTTTTPACATQDPAAAALNTLYMSYDEGTTTENVGVTIRFVQEPHATDGMWYYCGGDCYQGDCDCRVSASLLNHKMMINVVNDSAYPTGALSIDIGVVFDQATVEKTIGKCYYPYDGGTDRRYNRGCGCGMSNKNAVCSGSDFPQSAYKSIDPLTNQPMTSKSKDVHDCMCQGGARAGDPKKHTDAQCYWTGAGFFPNVTTENQINNMVKKRLRDQALGDKDGDPKETAYWNEVVIDGVAMEAEMAKDPSKVITAVVWMKGLGNDLHAYNAADQFSQWFANKGGFKTQPPVIAMDSKVDVSKCGPFTVWKPDRTVTV